MGFSIYFQRKRKLLAPLAVVAGISAVGVLALALPKADAHGLAPRHELVEPMRLLLLPARLSSAQFLAAYALVHG